MPSQCPLYCSPVSRSIKWCHTTHERGEREREESCPLTVCPIWWEAHACTNGVRVSSFNWNLFFSPSHHVPSRAPLSLSFSHHNFLRTHSAKVEKKMKQEEREKKFTKSAKSDHTVVREIVGLFLSLSPTPVENERTEKQFWLLP